MTKEQAMQQVKQSVYDATALFETLDKEGRLKAPGRQVREELSRHVAEFVSENWVSFDTSPNATELADAVKTDEDNNTDSGDGGGEGDGTQTDGGSTGEGEGDGTQTDGGSTGEGEGTDTSS